MLASMRTPRLSTIGPGAVPAPVNTPSLEIGPYELLGKIATGGMGTVFLCRRNGRAGFQRLMALKLMHPGLGDQPQFLSMFLDEARIAARLHHPNTVAIVDLGKSDRGYYVVMEYVEGCTLAQLLGKNPQQRSARLIVPIALDFLAGLHAAHMVDGDDGMSLGLVHRDVSGANILVGLDGVSRLTDFGIAKARARLTYTPAGTCKGKLSYAAPEQVSGGHCDARTDIFSAGVVLWNALTGKSLFRGDSDAETVNNVLTRPVPLPSDVGLRPPKCLDEICMRALERDPDARFQSAQEMAEALRAVASRHALLGTPAEVGRWVDTTFGDKLTARRQVVRRGGDGTALPSLPEIDAPDTAAEAELSSEHARRRRRRRVAMVVMVLALAAAAAAGLLLFERGRGGGEPAAAAAAADDEADRVVTTVDTDETGDDSAELETGRLAPAAGLEEIETMMPAAPHPGPPPASGGRESVADGQPPVPAVVQDEEAPGDRNAKPRPGDRNAKPRRATRKANPKRAKRNATSIGQKARPAPARTVAAERRAGEAPVTDLLAAPKRTASPDDLPGFRAAEPAPATAPSAPAATTTAPVLEQNPYLRSN
jgi:serine/threonine-protein kinase